MTDRESDPFHDDNITQEEFEAAMSMNFPQITIPDPVAVGKWLDEQQPDISSPQRPTFGIYGWQVCHWTGVTHIVPNGATPEELLVNLRAKLAEHAPLTKLHRDAAALGYAVAELPK